MKCIIATYYQYNNYGTKLQNYSLLKSLQKRNVDAYTLYPYDNKFIISNIVKNILSIFPITTKQKIWKNNYKKSIKFHNINKELNLKKVNYKYLTESRFVDYFGIAGSDQIWSPKYLEYNKKDIDVMFLKFINEKYRFAFAPSFGVSEVDENFMKLYKQNLADFKILSVRENRGAEIIKEMLNICVPVIPDPVFLFSRKEWEDTIVDMPKQKNYIVTYFLSKRSLHEKEEVNDFAKRNNLKIVDIMGNYYENNSILVDPFFFLSLIKNAKFVFTDSFHATVFSLIFNKNFTVYERTDVKQFSRIQNILREFKCYNYVKTDNIDDIHNHIVGDEQNLVLNNFNKKSNDFLNLIIKEVL